MTKYRSALPQLGDQLFLSDDGLKTALISNYDLDLPRSASFVLLTNTKGRTALNAYYACYAAIAAESGFGFILETPTWRANRDCGARIGYGPDALAMVNQEAVALMADLRAEFDQDASPCVISGCVGPRGRPWGSLHAQRIAEAATYHAEQIRTLADAGVDMVTATVMTNLNEAIGIALAARAASVPVAISFALGANGCLPDSETLGQAIRAVDTATDHAPVYYMVDCAEPSHLTDVLPPRAPWLERIRGVRLAASSVGLGDRFGQILLRLPALTVLGGWAADFSFRQAQSTEPVRLVA